MTTKDSQYSSDKQKAKAQPTNQYYESFHEKIRDQYKIPDDIPDEDLLNYIERHTDNDDKEGEEAFEKAGDMDDLLDDIRNLEDMIPQSVAEVKDRRKMLKDMRKELKYFQDYFDVNGNKKNVKIQIYFIEICEEGDKEISIRQPGRKKRLFQYDHDDFRYRSPDSGEWKTLIKILKACSDKYHISSIEDKIEARRKDFYRIMGKLILVIEKNFPNVIIPEDRKLYERCKGEGPGIYKFKFKIVSRYTESDNFEKLRKFYEKLSKEKLLSLLKKKSKVCRENPNTDYLKNEINIIGTVLIEKDNALPDEIADIIAGKTNEEQINDVRSTHEEEHENMRKKAKEKYDEGDEDWQNRGYRRK